MVWSLELCVDYAGDGRGGTEEKFVWSKRENNSPRLSYKHRLHAISVHFELHLVLHLQMENNQRCRPPLQQFALSISFVCCQ